MDIETVYQSKHAFIENLKEQYTLRIVWEGFIPTDEYIETLQNFLRLILESGYDRLISDQRKRKVLTKEASEYFTKTWYPALFSQTGGKARVAIVESQDVFGKVSFQTSVNNILKDAKNAEDVSLPYKLFNNMEDAVKWLENF